MSTTSARRTRAIAFITAGVICLAGAGGGAAYAHQERIAAQVSDLTKQVTAAQQAERDAVEALTRDIALANQRLTSDVDKVADPGTLTTLAQVVKAATAQKADAHAVPMRATVEGAQAALSAALMEVDTARAALSDLSAALLAETDSHTRWRLDQEVAKAAEAKTNLDSVIAAGRTVLADSEGKVADNAVREALAAALDAAQAVTDKETDPDSFTSLGRAITDRVNAANDVEAATAAVTEAVAAKAEADRRAAEEEAARRAAEEAAASKASQSSKARIRQRTIEGSDDSAGRQLPPSSTTETSAPADQPAESAAQDAPTTSRSIASIVEAEAARFGMRVNWVQLDGPAGTWPGGNIMNIDPDSNTMNNESDARSIVRHEAAHYAIASVCGTWDPPIAAGRAENVTDAYAEVFHGGLSYHYYGYTASDVEIARKINAGQCESDDEIQRKKELAARQAGLKPGDRVHLVFNETITGVVSSVEGGMAWVRTDRNDFPIHVGVELLDLN